MLIRAAVVDDAEALTDLHLDVWEEAYAGLMPDSIFVERRAQRAARIDRWRTNIETGPISSLVVEDDEPGRLLGFAGAGPARDDVPDLPRLELTALYVRAERYGTGLGHAMLQQAIGSAAAYLWVLDGNERATAFYERQGFRFDGETKTDPVGVELRMVRG
ncbi:GNAT family N-acetyltransferase [Nocardioides albus]|uniref:GNAT superfamily N-acetyltransferase n=1 Tax=Nocardioides albus TaxID=1841 RepID=A0A7W5FAD3_9ACTN|nr:GNAT family N-acetyltransferase [Nocardioides albus]MBB3091178.1 GNAT superfamily N-acetyltransferase [Nocardioides albus]GGU33795.1 N-acetyltransferase [Nocardioides albus]